MKITIGVPIWNQVPKYFRESLESIKNQIYQDFECIVLDDGSDNKEEVEKITKEFGFKYIYQKNGGIGDARQAIVGNASKESEFITFLSSDDLWEPTYLETMLKEAEKHPGKILYSKYYIIDEKGNITGGVDSHSYDNHEDFCVACFDYAYRNNMFVNLNTSIFPKKVFEKVKFKYEFGEDLYFLLISMKDFEYHLVPEYLLKYRAWGGNTTIRIRHKIVENNKKIIKEVLEFWKNG